MTKFSKSKSIPYVFIELFLLICILIWEFVLSTWNLLGLAWWAKVETVNPDFTYLFGPFISKKHLKLKLQIFLKEISNEQPRELIHSIIRSKQSEPFTKHSQVMQASVGGNKNSKGQADKATSYRIPKGPKTRITKSKLISLCLAIFTISIFTSTLNTAYKYTILNSSQEPYNKSRDK